MRTPVDALRSIVRYTALALGPDYEVRVSSEKGTFMRPSARVAQVPSIQMIAQRWDSAKFISSYSITVWPLPGVEADQSQMMALDVLDVLWVAFAGAGIPGATIRPPADTTRGTPYRVPLYDYDGIPLDGPTAFVDETHRDPSDFLHLEAPPDVQVIPDQADELLYSIAANIRMSWLRSAAVPSAQPVLQRVLTGAGTYG